MKTVKTIANQYYVATVSGEATVRDAASGLVLASAAEEGQVAFVAVGSETTVTDENAVVVPASFNGASAGSAAAGGARRLIDEALTTEEEKPLYDQPGEWDAIIKWAQIDGACVPPGVVCAVEVECTNEAGSDIETRPIWLALWEEDESGAQHRVAVSENSHVQAIGTTGRWTFAGAEVHGRHVRLCPTVDPAVGWDGSLRLGARTASAGAGEASFITTTSGGRSTVRLGARLITTVRTPKYAEVTALDEPRPLVSTNRLALGTFDDEGNFSRSFSMFSSEDMINMGGVNLKHGVSLSTPQLLALAGGSGSLSYLAPDYRTSYVLRWHSTTGDDLQIDVGNDRMPLALCGSSVTVNGSPVATVDGLFTDFCDSTSSPVFATVRDDTYDDAYATQMTLRGSYSVQPCLKINYGMSGEAEYGCRYLTLQHQSAHFKVWLEGSASAGVQGFAQLTDTTTEVDVSCSLKDLLGAPAAFVSHESDSVKHVTADERKKWNAKADASALTSKVNSATFTAHANDAVKHVTEEEREAWNAAQSVVASCARKEEDNAFTGNNAHAGVETFNGASVFNGDALLNGLSLKTIIGTQALNLELRSSQASAAGLNQVVLSGHPHRNTTGTPLLSRAGGDWRAYVTCTRIDQSLPGVVTCPSFIGDCGSNAYCGILHLSKQQLCPRAVSCLMFDDYAEEASKIFWSIPTANELLSPDTVLAFPVYRGGIIADVVLQQIHIFSDGLHDIVPLPTFNPDYGIVLVVFTSQTRGLTIMGRASFDKYVRWWQLYNNKTVKFGEVRSCVLCYQDCKNVTVNGIYAVRSDISWLADNGIFDDWKTL